MLKRTLSNSFGRGPLQHKMGGYTPPASIYFSACELRSKGKGDRREPIPPVFKHRLLARLILFYTTGLAVKKHLPTAKSILPSVAAVKGVDRIKIHTLL